MGSPPSMTATTEFVVPRSMPMTLSAIAPSSIGENTRHVARSVSGFMDGKSGTLILRQVGRADGCRPLDSSRPAVRVSHEHGAILAALSADIREPTPGLGARRTSDLT